MADGSVMRRAWDLIGDRPMRTVPCMLCGQESAKDGRIYGVPGLICRQHYDRFRRAWIRRGRLLLTVGEIADLPLLNLEETAWIDANFVNIVNES